MRGSRYILLTVMLALVGCGYSSESLIDSRYRTVYVEMFDNQSFYRGFEIHLTRALVNEINTRTDLRIVARDRADTVLSGRITNFEQTVLTEDLEDNVRELQVTLVVDMTWTVRRTGRPIKQVRGLTGTEQIKFDIDEALEDAAARLFEDTAERLVNQLEADW